MASVDALDRGSFSVNMPSNLTGSNSTALSPDAQHNFAALVFGILLIVIIICGNLLVCISVYKEKALKTTTNYFIVSLAVADLLLAVLVLPLFVYTQFQDGVWSLNMTTCDALMTMDVMLCTASIFNLCAISVDRFIAVSVPFNYNQRHVDQRQVGLLVGTWVLALAVASPVVFGINNVPGRSQRECKLENESYVIYSSICSFFIPCPLMLLLYCGMFRGLRRWEEARKSKLRSSMQTSQKLQEAAVALTTPLADSLAPPCHPGIQRGNQHPAIEHEVTLENRHPVIEQALTHKNLHTTTQHALTQRNLHPVVERDTTHSTAVCELTHKNFHCTTDHEPHTHVNLHSAKLMYVELSPVQEHTLMELSPVQEHTLTELNAVQNHTLKELSPVQEHTLMELSPVQEHTLTELSPVQEHTLMELKVEKLDHDLEPEPPRTGRLHRDSTSQTVPTVAYPNLNHNQQNHGRTRAKINRREQKAMRVLPVVVGAFLFCWTPFFVVHTLRATCDSCEVPPELMSTVTWLGYVNSAVNPVIYTVFNTEFRRFFRKFLSFSC